MSYQGVLSCASGTTQLVLGTRGAPGQDGLRGVQGIPGPLGASGSSDIWNYSLKQIDIVGPGRVFSFASLEKVILAVISKSNLSGGGNYEIRAEIRNKG